MSAGPWWAGGRIGGAAAVQPQTAGLSRGAMMGARDRGRWLLAVAVRGGVWGGGGGGALDIRSGTCSSVRFGSVDRSAAFGHGNNGTRGRGSGIGRLDPPKSPDLRNQDPVPARHRAPPRPTRLRLSGHGCLVAGCQPLRESQCLPPVSEVAPGRARCCAALCCVGWVG